MSGVQEHRPVASSLTMFGLPVVSQTHLPLMTVNPGSLQAVHVVAELHVAQADSVSLHAAHYPLFTK